MLSHTSPPLGSHLIFDSKINGLPAKVLTDGGAEVNAIDEKFVRKNNLPFFKLDSPIKLLNADSSLNSYLKLATSIELKLGDHKSKVPCYITKIPQYPLILGDPWLAEHDAILSHKKRTLTIHSSSLYNETISPPIQPVVNYALDAPKLKNAIIKIKTINATKFYNLARRQDHLTGVILPCSDDLQPKLYTVSTNKISHEDFKKFVSGKQKLSTTELKKRLPDYLHDLIDAFDYRQADKLPEHSPSDHQIILHHGENPPFVRKYRPMSRQELEAIRLYIEDLTAKGHIRPSSSSAAAPILLVHKPGGGLRVCIDYRGLNAITIKNRYPIPNIVETLNRLQGCKYFTKLDIIAAFNRIRIAAGDEWKTSFSTRYGQFEYLVMPFGLCNAPGTFQTYINQSLKDYLDLWATAYLDDVLIFSKTLDEHKIHVRKVVSKLLDHKLFIDINKCEFNMTEVKYLGLLVGSNGIRMDPTKIESILNWKTPTRVKDVQAFLGFANFYRRFIRDFSRLTKPLTDLTKNTRAASSPRFSKQYHKSFNWSSACQNSFDSLKKAFTSAPTLEHFDPARTTLVETDASDFVTAGVLSQMVNNVLKPVAFFSKKMSPTECNYEIYDKELLAIIKAFEYWRPELVSVDPDNPIRIYSDHKNLEWFMTTKNLNRRQARWAEFLSEFNFKIMFRPGNQGKKPDALTRRAQDLPTDQFDPRHIS